MLRGGGGRAPDGPGTDGPGTEGPGAVRVDLRPDGDGFGPVQRGRHRRLRAPRPGRLLRGAVGALLLAALLVVGGGIGLLVWTSLKIDHIQVSGLAGAAPTLNVLVVGSDSREGLSPEELLALGTEAVEGRRTDTIFVLSVDGGRAAMLAFPRDLFVTRCDGTTGRINGAYGIGGPSCLAQTVSNSSGIPITHYAEVDLAGFKSVVEAIGGVTIFLDEPLNDRAAGVDLPAGCVLLDGNEALGYVRARRADSDLGRIARQQRFLSELADEVASPATLLNPARLVSLAGASGEALTADDGLGPVELVKLARAARGLAGAGLATYTVPATDATRGGAAVLVPVEGEAETLFARFRDGSILQPAPPAAEPPPPAEAPPPAAAPPAPPAC